jgi:hypothetical protein
MEDIQDKLEMLIDEMEEDNTMPKSDILLALYRHYKEKTTLKNTSYPKKKASNGKTWISEKSLIYIGDR